MTEQFGLKLLPVGSLGTNCYLYWEKGSGRALVVDPGGDADRILQALRQDGLTAEAVLLTHGHYDHVLGLADLCRACPGIAVIAGEDEPEMMRFGRGPYPPECGEAADCITKTVAGGEELSLIGTTLSVLHTPGHSRGSVCFYDEAQELLFSGDTLFRESCGRVDLTGGNAREMRISLGILKERIPDPVIVLPGHMDWTDMAHEKEFNVYMARA